MVAQCLKRAQSARVLWRSLYYTPSLMPQSADPMPQNPAPDAEASPDQGAKRAQESDAGDAVNVHYDTRLPPLKWSRRIQIPIIAAAVYSVIRTLGPTLRYEVLGWQHAERTYASKKRCIFAFWHRVIIPISWWARDRGIVVMNTTAFDGQWTRKVIEWLGFGTAQGSSSRGGLRVYDRWSARSAICGEAGAGDAGAQDGMPGRGVSRRRRSRQNH
jgi:hypothetical protein